MRNIQKTGLSAIILALIVSVIYFLNPQFTDLQGSLQNQNSTTQSAKLKSLTETQTQKIHQLSKSEFDKYYLQKENKYPIFNRIALSNLIASKAETINNVIPSENLKINTPSTVFIFESDSSLNSLLTSLKSTKANKQTEALNSLSFIDLIQVTDPDTQKINFESYISNKKYIFAMSLNTTDDLLPTEFVSLLVNKAHTINKAAGYLNLENNNPNKFKAQYLKYQDFLKGLYSTQKNNFKFLITGIYNQDNIQELQTDMAEYPQIFFTNKLSEYKKYLFFNNLTILEGQNDLQKMYITNGYFNKPLSTLDQWMLTFKLNFNFSQLREQLLYKNKTIQSFDPSLAHLIKNSEVQIFQTFNSKTNQNANLLNPEKINNINLQHLCQNTNFIQDCDQKLNLQIHTASTNKTQNLQLELANFQGVYINSNNSLTNLLQLYNLQNKRLKALRVSQDPNQHIDDLDNLNTALSEFELKIVRQINSNSIFNLNEFTGEKLTKTISSCQILGQQNCQNAANQANFHYLIGMANNQLNIIEITKASNLLSHLLPSANAFFDDELPPGLEELLDEDLGVPALERLLENNPIPPGLEERLENVVRPGELNPDDPDDLEGNNPEQEEDPAIDIPVPAIVQEILDDQENPALPFIRRVPRVINVPVLTPLEELLEPPFIAPNINLFPAPPFINNFGNNQVNLLIPPFIGNVLFGRGLEAQPPFIRNGDAIFEGEVDPAVGNDNNNNAGNQNNNNGQNQNNQNRRSGGGGGGRRGSGGGAGGSLTNTEQAYVPCTETLPYLDIQPDDPNFYKFVWAYCSNIFTGKILDSGERNLDPDANFNRAEFTKIGVMLSQTPIEVSDRKRQLYKDIPLDSQEWYYDFLNTATNNKFVTGYKDEVNFGKFLPENTISFAETLSIALRTSIEPKLVGNTQKDPWHTDLINNYKNINGIGKLTPPNTPITRKQALLIIYDLWSKGLYGEKFM